MKIRIFKTGEVAYRSFGIRDNLYVSESVSVETPRLRYVTFG